MQTESRLKILLRAESIIQRDAILAALAAADIQAFTARRDISRKIADSTVDLAYEGYSAVFDGFVIQVDEQDFDAAKEIARSILSRVHLVDVEEIATREKHLHRFYFCSLFSITFPFGLQFVALYHFVKGLRAGERPNTVFTVMSFVVLAASLWLGIVWGQHLVEVAMKFLRESN